MSIEASGKNMELVCKARDVHDRTCPYGGSATHVHLNWFDIERLGWEEGDTICGLVVVGDEKVATGTLRVTCDAEPDDLDGLEEVAEDEVVEAVSADRELVTPEPLRRTVQP